MITPTTILLRWIYEIVSDFFYYILSYKQQAKRKNIEKVTIIFLFGLVSGIKYIQSSSMYCAAIS